MKLLRGLHRGLMQAKESKLAKSSWKKHWKEKKALSSRTHFESIGRVDQIWPWLAARYCDLVAVDAPHAAHPENFSYFELAETIGFAASAFYGLGTKKGDVIALFAENSPRWLIADQALMRLDAANAVRGASAPLEELRYILEDSGSSGLIVQSAELWKQLALTKEQKSKLKFVLQLEGEAELGIMGWGDFLESGKGKKAIEITNQRGMDSSNSTMATILYTSGTTGQPKGVPLKHSNLIHQIKSLACIAHPLPGAPVLSVLPIWHAYERSAEYYFFSCGCTQTYTTIKHLKNDLVKIKPIVMVTVPRLWEAVQMGFDDAVKKMPKLRQLVLKTALTNSKAHTKSWRTTRNLLLQPVNPLKRLFAFCECSFRWPFHRFASGIIWPKVLAQLCGGRLRFPINGGGAIAPHVDSFFESLGVEMLVGYGLTETSPVVSCRRPWRNIRGSSGLPLPGTQFKIVNPENKTPLKFRERGLVLVKGPQVMNGYLGKPDATKKVLDKDGWFNTGDLGMLLPDGSIVITGRAKDTIVLSNGENIEPGPLEETLLGSPLVEQVMLVGQDERLLGALIVPNFEEIKLWATQKGIALTNDFPGTASEKALLKSLRGDLNLLLANRRGARVEERLVGLAFVEPFTIENGLLTQTLKQRRERISERDQLKIKAIYSR